MVDLPRDTNRASLAERHLGLIAAIAGLTGLVAMCGSPLALWNYIGDLADMVWSAAGAIFG